MNDEAVEGNPVDQEDQIEEITEEELAEAAAAAESLKSSLRKDSEPECEHFIPRRTFLQSPIVQAGLIYVSLKAIEAWVTVKKIEAGRSPRA